MVKLINTFSVMEKLLKLGYVMYVCKEVLSVDIFFLL